MALRPTRRVLAASLAALSSLAPASVGLPGPVAAAAPHDSARANAYDDAWEADWVAHCRSIYRTAGKTAGFVLQVGDSITHSNPYCQWPRYGAGQTAADAALTAWCQASAWNTGSATDTGVKNGWYLAAADTSGSRGMTAASGIDTAELLSGNGNGGTAMPSDTNAATAKAKVADGGTYSGNLHITTVCAAFADAQFAVLMLGTNDVTAGRAVGDFSADLTGIVNAIEGQNIVVVLSTIPPHFTPTTQTAVIAYNSAIRSFAQARGLPLIDFHEEILLRRPGTTWNGTLLGFNDVHPSASGGGYNSASDPYAAGGDAATHTTGEACLQVGYLLRSWLTVQKLKEVKSYVADGVSPPVTPPTPAPGGGGGGDGGGGGCFVASASVTAAATPWAMFLALLSAALASRRGLRR